VAGKAVVRALERAGFERRRQRGSHVILVRQEAAGLRGVVVPLHAELDRGTLLEIIRQSGLSREEFLRHL
jgi:predicted RNA binding protein YcfA (HicA-like mRNA interferase family)